MLGCLTNILWNFLIQPESQCWHTHWAQLWRHMGLIGRNHRCDCWTKKGSASFGFAPLWFRSDVQLTNWLPVFFVFIFWTRAYHMWAKLCMNRIMHMYIQVICIWSTFAVQYVHIIYQSFVPVCYENPSFQELRTQLIAHNGSVQHLPLPEDMKVNSADGFGKFSPEEIQKGMGSFKRCII